MGIVSSIFIIGLAMLVGYGAVQAKIEGRNRKYRNAAARLRLAFAPGTFFSEPSISGKIKGDLTVMVDFGADGKRRHVRIRVMGLPKGIVLWHRGHATAEPPSPVKTGDPELENRFHVGGSRRPTLALLDASRRKALVALNPEQRPSIANGTAEWRISELPDEDILVSAIREAIEISQAIVPAGTVDERLEKNAAHDPLHVVRLRNLLTLLEESPGSETASRAAATALSDPDASVRLCGAWESGDAGLPIAESILADAKAPAGIREQALTLLGERAPAARACKAARAVLRPDEDGRVTKAAAAVLGRHRDAESLPRILSLFAAGDASVREKAAAAAGRIGSSDAEPALLRLLFDPEPAVRLATASALGRAGTVEAIASLRDLQNTFMAPGVLKTECEKAIARIQSRIAGAGAGQLALVDDANEAGALTLPDARADDGALSIPDPGDAPSSRPNRAALASKQTVR